ncbi:hypothetical protein NESM_000027000 [Novymonas esmeraldas]|uniref:Uncharacterized protein n=1 Tax=Novymonas esmeraldas TaxID=1808958 RepID=A0AAW0F0Z0_9TRYP
MQPLLSHSPPERPLPYGACSLSVSGYHREPETLGDTNNTQASCDSSSTSPRGRPLGDVRSASVSPPSSTQASPARVAGVMLSSPYLLDMTTAAANTPTCSISIHKDPATLHTGSPFVEGICGAGTAAMQADSGGGDNDSGVWMCTDSETPPRIGSLCSAVVSPVVISSPAPAMVDGAERCAGTPAALLPPPISTASLSSAGQECRAAAAREHGSSATYEMLSSLVSSPSTSAAPLEAHTPLHAMGLVRCDSTSLMRRLHQRGRRVQVLGAPLDDEEEGTRLHTGTSRLLAFHHTSPQAHLRCGFSPAPHLGHDATTTPAFGAGASRLPAGPTPPLHDGAAVAATAVASGVAGSIHDGTLRSLGSSMLTFVDHELDSRASDSIATDMADAVHGESDKRHARDGSGGLRRLTSASRSLHTSCRSPLLATPHVAPFLLSPTPRRRGRLTGAAAAAPLSQVTVEYAAAIQAAAKYGCPLRQLLAMRCDDGDEDTWRDSEGS